jgi:16S rRNA (guanine1207-N2)-methyltransferase
VCYLNIYLAEYPQANVTCYNTNFEDHQKLKQINPQQAQYKFVAHYQTTIKHDLVVIAFPKSKSELTFTLAMIAEYLSENAQIIIVVEKNSGIKSCPKLSTAFLQQCNKVDSARHCMLFTGQFNNRVKPFKLEAWFKHYQVNVEGIELNVASLPGVFSQDDLDIGTALLLKNLPSNLQGNILDFGCGAGVIASYIGKKYDNTLLTLIDINALALASAEKTLKLNQLSGNCFASNSLSTIVKKYNHVVSNPPFHQGIKTNYQATESFLKGIKGYIAPKGSLSLVANSFLRYLPIMEDTIGRTTTVCKQSGFSIYYCRL